MIIGWDKVGGLNGPIEPFKPSTEYYRGYTNKVHYLIIIILTHDICPLAL